MKLCSLQIFRFIRPEIEKYMYRCNKRNHERKCNNRKETTIACT